MNTNALAELEPDAPTAKRAQYEAFEFALEAPGLLRVMNGSYGDDEKGEHTYRVNVESGVPVACECPADTYHGGACKHRVAVAIREPVLEAATAGDGPQSEPVATDGGIVVADDEGEVLEAGEDDVETDGKESADDCDCDLLSGDYPCAHCYIEEGAEWPDEGTDDRPE